MLGLPKDVMHKHMSNPSDVIAYACGDAATRDYSASSASRQKYYYTPSSVSGQEESISRCDWLPEWARWSYVARSGYGLCPTRKIYHVLVFYPTVYNKSYSVKMAGYWPHSFFACL